MPSVGILVQHQVLNCSPLPTVYKVPTMQMYDLYLVPIMKLQLRFLHKFILTAIEEYFLPKNEQLNRSISNSLLTVD